MTRHCTVGSVTIGSGQPLTVIAGPCVLESLELGIEIGGVLKDTCDTLGLGYIFKASFDKANRTSIHSARGPGLERGLEWLARIREHLDVPVTTDIHEPVQATPVARAVDLLQIPAFLCRQTDLLTAAGRAAREHGRAVNVKKGQFLSPGAMVGPITKLSEVACTNLLVTERGTFFGYGRLVNDFVGLAELMRLDAPDGPVPVCFDCTHSTQQPGDSTQTGGSSEHAPLLARAATAAGVPALFLECHPDPPRALSDASTMIRLADAPGVLKEVSDLRASMVGV